LGRGNRHAKEIERNIMGIIKDAKKKMNVGIIDKKEYDMSKILLFWYTGQNEYLKGKCDGKKRKMVTVGG